MELALRHLQIVVIVAEEGSIGRAASTLRIAQSGLTAQLGRIEREIGAPLFTRRPDGVVPTELGTHVLLGAKAVISQFDDLVSSSRSLAHRAQPTSVIRLGGVDSAWIPTIGSTLRQLLPGREQLTYVEESSAAVLDLVQTRKLDLAVITEYPDSSVRGHERLAIRELCVEPLLVGLAADHPLADRDRLTLADLARESWIAPPDGAGGLRLSLRMACERVGFSPRFRYFGADHGTAATIVGSGTAVGLFPSRTGQVPGVRFRHLADEPLWCRTQLVWQPASPMAEIAPEIIRSLSDERFRAQRDLQPFRLVAAKGPTFPPATGICSQRRRPIEATPAAVRL